MKQFYDMAQRQAIEPFMAVEVSVPFEFSTTVQGGLISREGTIINVEGNADSSYITAEVPLANMFGYISELRLPHYTRVVSVYYFSPHYLSTMFHMYSKMQTELLETKGHIFYFFGTVRLLATF